MSTKAPEQRNEALRRLAHASEDVRAAKSRYLAEQEASWQRYVAVVDKALVEDLRLGEPSPPPASDPAHELLDAIRGRLDDLRVQSHLGRMDLEDLAAELHTAANHVVDLLRP